jgi:hypothetical protein
MHIMSLTFIAASSSLALLALRDEAELIESRVDSDKLGDLIP